MVEVSCGVAAEIERKEEHVANLVVIGIVIRNKARLVAQGHRQEEGIDYEEVFAPMTLIEAIRLFLAYASFMGFMVYQMDVKSVFLYGTIEEEVYVTQPPGFKDPDHPDKVYKVVKALYGLHQAPKACQDKYVAEILKKFNYTDVKSASTPVDLEKPLVKDGDADVKPFRNMGLGWTVRFPHDNATDANIIKCDYVSLNDADVTLALFVGDPIHVEDALAEDEWRMAMQDELSAIQKNKTWELVDLLSGYAQQHNIDYKETFSPVARFETIRIILAVVAQQQWKLYHFDVKSAFLNGDLKEEVYVSQPPGFEIKVLVEYYDTTEIVKDTLKNNFIAGCKITPTLMNINEKFSIDDGTGLTDAKIYMSLVGRLIYVTHSRPDVAYSVGVLSRYMHNPCGAAKHVLRYLAGTKDHESLVRSMKKIILKGYCDSDWQAQLKIDETRRVISFFLAQQWYLGDRKKATVALSSTEPKNPILHGRTKHMEIKHHYIRELIAKGEARLESCRTDEQVADLLTKALPQVKPDDFKAHLGVLTFE
ncbi:copia protein [Tanacetum coccineum]